MDPPQKNPHVFESTILFSGNLSLIFSKSLQVPRTSILYIKYKHVYTMQKFIHYEPKLNF